MYCLYLIVLLYISTRYQRDGFARPLRKSYQDDSITDDEGVCYSVTGINVRKCALAVNHSQVGLITRSLYCVVE